MVSTLILWLAYAVVLKVAVAFAADVPDNRNSLARAFIGAGLLSIGNALFAKIGAPGLLWIFAWLFIVKSVYGIGWGRAVLVWLGLVVVFIALAFLVLIPLGLMAAIAL